MKTVLLKEFVLLKKENKLILTSLMTVIKLNTSMAVLKNQDTIPKAILMEM